MEKLLNILDQPAAVLNKDIVLEYNYGFSEFFKINKKKLHAISLFELFPELIKAEYQKFLKSKIKKNWIARIIHVTPSGREELSDLHFIKTIIDDEPLLFLRINKVDELFKHTRFYNLLVEINSLIFKKNEISIVNKLPELLVGKGEFNFAAVYEITKSKDYHLINYHPKSKTRNNNKINILSPSLFNKLLKGKSLVISGSNNIKSIFNSKIFSSAKSLVIIPIFRDRQINNIVVAADNQYSQFDNDQTNVLNDISSQVSFALDKLQDEKKIESYQLENKEYLRRLNSLIANLPGVAYICKNDRYYTTICINDGIIELAGYSASEILNNKEVSFSSLIKNEFKKEVKEKIKIALTKRESYTLTYKINTKDKKEKWVWEKGNGIYNVRGKVTALEGIIMDITEIKDSQLKAEQNEEKYKNFFEDDLSADVISNIDGKIIQCNQAFVDLFGFKDSAQAKSFNIKQLYKSISDRNELIRMIRFHNKVFNYEIEMRTIDGKTLTIRENGVGVFDKTGRLKGFRGYLIDITEQKRIEKELRANEKFLTTTLNSIGDGIISVNTRCKIIYINPVAEELTGWKKKDAIGKMFDDVFIITNATTGKHVSNPLKKVFTSGKIVELANHTVLHSKDRIKYHIADSAAPITDESGKITGAVLVFRDVTSAYIKDKEILESELKFSAAFRTNPDPIAITKLKDGLMIDINQGFVDLSGYSREEAIGKTSIELNLYTETMQRWKILNDLKNNGSVINYKMNFRLKSGAIIPALFSANVFNIKDEPYIISITKDISNIYEFENLIKESEEKFRNVFLSLPDPIILIKDNENSILDCNDRFLKLINKAKDEVITKNYLEYLVWLNEEDKESFIKAVKYNDSFNSFPAIMSWNDIGFQACEISASKFYYKNEYCLIIIFRNVDQLYKANQKIKISERRYKNLFEGVQSAILIIDPSNGRIIDSNHYAQMFYGYSKEDFHLMNITDINVFNNDQLHELMNMAKYDEKYNFIFTHKLANGEYKDVEVTGNPIIIDDKVYLFSIVYDVSEKRKMTEELLKLNYIIDQTPVMVLLMNREGSIQYVNPAFTKFTGYTLEEVYGKTAAILDPENHSKEQYNIIKAVFYQGNNWRGESSNKRKNGQLYWESVIVSPIKNSKNVITNFVAMTEDISDRKKIESDLIAAKEKAERSDKLKSEFLAQISHEIRTPLNTMLSFSSLIRTELGDSISDDINESFEVMNKSGRRIVRTIDLILNLSELQTGSYDSNPELIDLEQDILNNCLRDFKSMAKKSGLLLSSLLEIDEPKIVADRYSIEQIFSNLIDNAIKYTEEGEVLIRTSLNKENKIVTEISDTGIGISKEFLDDIFKPFSQEEQGYTRKYEGTGLGLTLTKNYCKLNNIKLEIESEKGKGSTFRLVFP